ncbi:amidohydrolase [Gymnodinialimonas hymeniacidonis]|uniref:amidohydrolase family protein n=1 Tax=Gymnodinialimonas hymeniacidonis TaxID=3126508 RepID=UPI0034C5EBC8
MALNDLLPSGYIDAHHHVWAPDTRGDEIGYGWLRDIGAPKPFGDPTPIQRDYLMEEFLAEAEVAPRASVHVQTDGALPDPVAETAFVQAEADRCDHTVRIVGLADLSAGDLAETLARHGAYNGFCGVRQIVGRLAHRPDLTFAPRDFMAENQWREGLKRLEGDGLTFDLQMYPEQAEQALEALSATPALRVIIDHALCPYDQRAEGYELWNKAVGMLAARPNTWIKLSGWGMYDSGWDRFGVEAIQPYVDDIMLSFGADRVMWGSNYPVEKLAKRYQACIEEIAGGILSEQHDAVFLLSAATAYGVKLT